jgi:polar amino acid transport system substrate-binding protein
MGREHLIVMIGLSGICLLGSAKENGIKHANHFQPNPNCTMPDTWDPDVGLPSAAALEQLAPTGRIRVGIYTGNFLNATVDPVTGALTGPAIDLFCRFATYLNLPLEFTTYPTVQQAQIGFDSDVWEIGASTDQFGTIVGASPANAYSAINATLMVDDASPIVSVADADQPGTRIAVQAGIAIDIYLRAHFRHATLVEVVTGSAPRDVFPLVQHGCVDVAAGGRSGLTSFVASQYPGGRVLDDTLVDIETAPYVHPNNDPARCYLTEYIEAAKASGLLFQAWSRLTPAQQFGTGVAPPHPLCEKR